MLTLVQNGDLFAPVPLGVTNVLPAEGSIVKVGEISAAVECAGVGSDLIGADGCAVTPRFIDPNQHVPETETDLKGP